MYPSNLAVVTYVCVNRTMAHSEITGDCSKCLRTSFAQQCLSSPAEKENNMAASLSDTSNLLHEATKEATQHGTHPPTPELLEPPQSKLHANEPCFSNSPEPPENSNVSELKPPSAQLLTNLPNPPLNPSLLISPEPQEDSNFTEVRQEPPNPPVLQNSPNPAKEPCDPSLSNLPEPPEEPLPTDCCGTGCSPCVFDIYEQDMKIWRELASLAPEERSAQLQTPSRGGGGGAGREVVGMALSPLEYRRLEVVEVEQVSSDSYVFTFGLPGDQVLGVGVGQHAVLR